MLILLIIPSITTIKIQSQIVIILEGTPLINYLKVEWLRVAQPKIFETIIVESLKRKYEKIKMLSKLYIKRISFAKKYI